MPTKSQKYWQDRPSLVEALRKPDSDEEAIEIYDFICKASVYSIDRGGGMGMSVQVAPDMLKICDLGDKYGIEILRYEDYCENFLTKKSELEHKKK